MLMEFNGKLFHVQQCAVLPSVDVPRASDFGADCWCGGSSGTDSGEFVGFLPRWSSSGTLEELHTSRLKKAKKHSHILNVSPCSTPRPRDFCITTHRIADLQKSTVLADRDHIFNSLPFLKKTKAVCHAIGQHCMQRRSACRVATTSAGLASSDDHWSFTQKECVRWSRCFLQSGFQ